MQFLNENFLLEHKTSVSLYHDVAKNMPIYDFHCHLSPKEIYEDRRYENIGEMMLGGDHYKWRAMRSAGTKESLVCGTDDYFLKFQAFAKTLGFAQGNPLLHWTHLELQRVFGIEQVLTVATAGAIWDAANAQLDAPTHRARGLIQRFGVKLCCTTDDPADDLQYHKALAKEDLGYRVLPTFRPDRALNIYKADFAEYAQLLGKAAGVSVAHFSGFLDALETQLEVFHEVGARSSDHGLEDFDFERTDIDTARRIYREAMLGKSLAERDVIRYRSFLLCWLGEHYAKKGWVQQYHMSAMRANNTRMLRQVGADTGFDSIGDGRIAKPLSRLLDAMDSKDALPKTVLYSLNPNDNYTLGSMIGNFQGGEMGKMQWGSGWWFNDQRDGMEAQLKALGNLGLLGCFVGMLTDSRSFVSYTRHEYFRRIFCNLIGKWVEAGELPNDAQSLHTLVQDVCSNNARKYFGAKL